MRAKDALGEYGERVAVRYLCESGWRILERRWRCALGEIDIIAQDDAGERLLICEVKTRRSTVAGHPLEAVTPDKLARLHRLAASWLAEQDRWFPEVRFDVVAVTVPRRGGPRVEHLEAVS
jgi:putative endonuclease